LTKSAEGWVRYDEGRTALPTDDLNTEPLDAAKLMGENDDPAQG
jgi:hypothetical protein